LQERDPFLLFQHPWLMIGLIDAFFMLCCFLNVTDAFPLIRVRFMFGLGYFGFLYWSWNDIPSMGAAVVASIAIYMCTASLNFFAICISVGLGIVASGTLALLAIGT